MAASYPPGDVAMAVIAMILDDPQADQSVRELAFSLRSEASHRPHIVVDRLKRASTSASYTLAPATDHLAKVVSIERFWNHYLSQTVKAYFPDPLGYQAFVSQQPDPGVRLLGDLEQEFPLVPAIHSWLTSYRAVRDRRAASLVRDLELEPSTQPPLAVLVIPEPHAHLHGVQIREPRATDALIADQLQWRQTGLVSGLPEWIDLDIPREAVSSVEWRT